MHSFFIQHMPIDVNGLSEFADFFAFGVTVLFSLAIAIGAKESSIVNNVFTFLNLAVVLFVIVVGSFKADPENWQVPASEVPDGYGSGGFAPYGIAGIVKGAAICFYGFIGFDCIATAGEEARNPKRAMPIAIVGSLFVVFLAYFGVSTVITMMLPYFQQDENAPLIYVFDYYDWPVAKYIVSVGAIFGLCASLMGSMFPLPRIVYAMSNDGLIFKWLGEIHPRFQTPLYGTMFVGILTGTLAAFLNLTQLVHMMSIGTLMAYSIVAACVLLLRYEVENQEDCLRIPAPFHKNIARFLWNKDNVRTPSKYTSLIVMCEVTAFCKLTVHCRYSCNAASMSLIWVFVSLVFPAGIFALMFALVVELLTAELADLVWWAWTLLALCGVAAISLVVLVTRQPVQRPTDSFQVPFLPWLPALSIAINLYLMVTLDIMTWVRFSIWIIIGLAVYFAYGIFHSFERSRNKQRDLLNDKQNGNKIFASSHEILVPTGQ